MEKFSYSKHLIRNIKLKPDYRYDFLFEDGTGCIATPEEFDDYANRRFAWNPEDSFEIADYDIPVDESEYKEYSDTDNEDRF